MKASEYHNIFNNESNHFFYISNHEAILKLIQRYAHDKGPFEILDAGCGTGLLAKKMSKFGKVIGIDFSPLAVKLSKKRGVNTLLASVTKLPFKTNSFDIVVSIDVLYHTGVEDDTKALKEFFRVLKPGGLLLLKLPAYNWLRGKHDIVVHTKHRFTANEVKTKLLTTGFKIKQVTYFSTFLLPLAIIKRFIEKLQTKKADSDVNTPPRIVNSFLIFLYRVEIWILKYINLPFGLSVLSIAQKPK